MQQTQYKAPAVEPSAAIEQIERFLDESKNQFSKTVVRKFYENRNAP